MAGSRSRLPVGGKEINGQSKTSRRESAEYIASLLEGLRCVANQARMPFLTYLLSVALEEANAEKGQQD